MLKIHILQSTATSSIARVKLNVHVSFDPDLYKLSKHF